MDTITSMLESLLNEQKIQKEELKAMQQHITTAIITNINEKFNEIDNKYKFLVEKIEKQEKQIDHLEKENRKRNLLFFGIDEEEKGYFDLQTKILSLITSTMNLPCEKFEIENVKRIGLKRDKIRPVTVTFSTMGKKIEILKNKNTLANSSCYIKEDFPKNVQEIRKHLQPHLQKLRSEGKKAIIKYDKIIILEERDSKEKKKRVLSPSPITQKSSKHTKKVQPAKKNKADITNFLSLRNDSSLQEK